MHLVTGVRLFLKKFYDLIPPLLEKKYLKTMYCCHECADTLDKGDIDGGEQMGSDLKIELWQYFARGTSRGQILNA